MKRKLLAIVALIAVVFVAAVLWRVDSFVFGDRMNWAEAQARSQMVSIHHALQVELKGLERIVYSFTSENFRKDKINWNSLQPYYAVASLNLGAQGDPQVQNLFVKDKSVAFNWNADFLSKAIGRITSNKGSAGGTQVFVKPFQGGNNKERHVALVFVNGSKAYALVGAGEIFQSLIDAQKGSLNSFSVVSTAGLTVGHSVPEYVGTLLSEDPMFKVAMQSGVTQGVGVFDSSDGQKIFGLYNQVPNSNLLILSSAPVKDIMKGRGALLWQFFLLGIGLVLVGVAGILLAIRPQEKSLEQLRLHAAALIAGKKDFHPGPMTAEIAEIDGLLSSLQVGGAAPATLVSAPIAAPKSVAAGAAGSGASVTPLKAPAESPEKIQQEKMEAYRRVASALGHEMRPPLSSILGYSQLVLSRSQDPEIVASIDSILRESRAARTILEKLFSFAGEQELAKSEMKVETALGRALASSQTLFSQKGVKLEKDLAETSTLPISADELIRAFENIFTNAVEAMERMPQKTLTVRLFENTEGIHLQINDTGEGIEQQNLSQIFDPFFTTRSFQNHVGLGLAVVVGVLKEHGATVQVHSVRGQGTQFHILFTKKAEKSGVMGKDWQTESIPSQMTQSVTLQPLAAPPSALIAAQEKAIDELKDFSEDTVVGNPPMDVNIDSLLELPPATAAKASPGLSNGRGDHAKRDDSDVLPKPNLPTPPAVKSAEKPSLKPPAPPPKVAASQPPAGASSATEQEFTFIDGFLSDNPAQAPATPPPRDPEATVVLNQDLAQISEAPVDADVPKSNITAPKVPPPPPKSSRLDAYQVDIRKPGKR